MSSKPIPIRRKAVTRPTRPFRRPGGSFRFTWDLTSHSPHHTERLGHAIGRMLQGGETLALFGPLGAGKTALVRGIAQGLGAAPAAVSSPTFVLIHEYRGRLPLIHVDLYRIHSLPDLESTGLLEYLAGPAITAIEWADRGLTWLPKDRLEIELRHQAVGSRTIRLTATGIRSAALFAKTKARFGSSPGSVRSRRHSPKATPP